MWFFVYFIEQCSIYCTVWFDNGSCANSYQPPNKIKFVHNDSFSIRPFVYPYIFKFNDFFERIFIEDQSKPYYLTLFPKGDSISLLRILPTDRHLFGLSEQTNSCRFYLFSADAVGRDLFSRIVFDSRVSLTIGFLGVAVTAFFGFLIGGISGFYGGKTDWILMRFAECFMLVPSFFLMLALCSAFPMKLSSTQI